MQDPSLDIQYIIYEDYIPTRTMEISIKRFLLMHLQIDLNISRFGGGNLVFECVTI